MTSPKSILRKLSFLSPLFALVFGLAAAHAQSDYYYNESTPVSGGGTLGYQLEVENGYCGNDIQNVADMFQNFTYTPAGGSATGLSGSIDYVFPCDSGYYNISGGWDYESNSYSSDGWSNQLNLSYGSCTITFNAYEGGGGSASIYCPPPPTTVTGYIDPKYIVLGVTYAPPGPQSYVTYSNSQTVATTVSLANSFTNTTSYSVSLSINGSMPGFKGGLQVTSGNTATQTSKNSQSDTLSWSTANTIKTYGTPNAYAPVNNDYDLVYVWLNPVEVLTGSSNGSTITWNGFGYDANDQNGMDIVAIPMGYLDGDFGAMPPDITALTNRTWADGQQFSAGESAALNSTDFAVIATYDPFSNTSYGIDDIGYEPPVPSTPDNRFTLTECNSDNSISYQQPPPGQSPSVYTCTLNYSNLSSSAQDITTSNSTAFSLDLSFTEGTFVTVTQDFKYSSTQTTTTEADNSISNTQASSAVLSVSSPPCTVSGSSCNPVYDGGGNEPVEFFIYQDNMYGTFMLAPYGYY